MDKKGVSGLAVVGGIIIAFILIIGMIILTYYTPAKQTSIIWLDDRAPNIDWDGPIGWGFLYVLGINEDRAPTISAIVVLVAVWLIFFLALGDMFANFGLFKEPVVPWLIGLALAVILANLGFLYDLLVNFMGIFAFLAGFSVIASLLSIFVVMFLVHWGVAGAGRWILIRRAYHEAATAEAGGVKLGGRLKGLAKAGKVLKKI